MGKGGRLALVIGSQCESLGPGKHLKLLRKAAEELDDVLCRSNVGGCAPALPGRDGPLLDPTRQQMDTALADAFNRADRDGAVLVLAYIGHGLRTDSEYYVLPANAQEDLGARVRPYPLIFEITHFLTARPALQGLILLLDTCDSGKGAATAGKRWLVLNEEDMDRRFQVLTSSSLEPSYDCAFSRQTALILRNGSVRHDRQLFCPDIRAAIVERDILEHQPVCLGYDGGALRSEALWLGRNQAPAALARDLRHFQATADVGRLVTATVEHPLTMVQAPAGSGKTTLLAALTRPELHKDIPEGFVHARHELRSADDVLSVARSVTRQLRTSVPGFDAAYVEGSDGDSRESLLKALDRLSEQTQIEQTSMRIALDGLDQLRPTALPEISALVAELIYRQGYRKKQPIPGLRVLVSGRPEATPSWLEYKTVNLDSAHEDQIKAYLTRRGVGQPAHRPVIERSGGNWLVASLLADWLDDYGLDTLPDDADDTYTRRLEQILGDEPWEESVIKAVLTVLTSAASATGAVAILAPVLLEAAADLHRSATPQPVNRALQRLSRLVVSRPLDGGEQSYALFHPTLAQYLAAGKERPGQEFAVDVTAGHEAVGRALHKLAPTQNHADGDPLYDYAAEAEATHYWERDDTKAVVRSLVERASAIPQTNLLRWSSWLTRFRQRLDPHDLSVLIAQLNVAFWTEECGDRRAAHELYHELEHDCQKALGSKRPDTAEILELRAFVASRFTDDDLGMALGYYRKLESDCRRALGRDHPVTLSVRNNIASCLRMSGDAAGALSQFHMVVRDSERLRGPFGSRLHLTARNGVAACLGMLGSTAEALASWGALLVEVERHLGQDDELAGHVRQSMFITLRPLVD